MGRFNIQNQIQSIIIVRHLTAQSTEVEVVLDVIVINLAEEFISSQIAEPRDPLLSYLFAGPLDCLNPLIGMVFIHMYLY